MAPKKQQATSGTNTNTPDTTSEALPPLSPQEFRIYNRLAEHMDQFVSINLLPSSNHRSLINAVHPHPKQHNHFRLTWTQLQDACSTTGTSKRAAGLSPRQLIMTGLSFCSQLDFHHSIEEQHVFPVLAKKMPEFRRELALLTQHKRIHAGLEALEAYLMRCRAGEVELQRAEVKRLLDAFGEVLWAHLDDEVRALGAENMRRFWSVKEMGMLPM
ncbi:hemerythrin domain-containing protein [Aspergillus clavatus NRRL 1]|uniref:Hemerythrin-like domain-containing protein n=1 Tax=Aspergillus clavatus (strain ATCC 1007 / CBS 513.65 / DSM 816 / NCTC 3887 / NRRL 1 / QM 1276 / 107) TaxID=344612 RepID=A1CGB9_ASPCL|nr:uncharacterized protein ACLA_066350 [Aspergillus clavatus NRRL 1]EAW10999.1 conserved hypothetical protein [Aspergillus clavatus NRRL 1]